MNQESTEELTKTLIEESKDIMKLLERDNIKVEEVCDYHIYPIADNDTPMLSLCYRDDATRFYMQAIADILKKISEDGLITKKDLYELKESEVIYLIRNSKYEDIFMFF